MKKQILAQFNSPDLILFAFLLFLATFLGVVLWTLKKSNQAHFKRMAEVPLRDGEGEK